jgi:DNA-binding MarR family transcriptional regulator
VVAPRPIDRSTRHAENPRPGQLEGADGQLKITATQQRILDALAWLESIGNDQPSTLQVGAIALIDATGGHFSNTVGPLSSNGLIERGAGTISLTDEGRKYARIPEQISSLADYHDMLRQRVRRAKSAGGKTVDI